MDTRSSKTSGTSNEFQYATIPIPQMTRMGATKPRRLFLTVCALAACFFIPVGFREEDTTRTCNLTLQYAAGRYYYRIRWLDKHRTRLQDGRIRWRKLGSGSF